VSSNPGQKKRLRVQTAVRLNQRLNHWYLLFLRLARNSKKKQNKNKSKYGFTWIEDNMSEWSDMPTHGLLFQWDNNIKCVLA
jgi:hypothetical protein